MRRSETLAACDQIERRIHPAIVGSRYRLLRGLIASYRELSAEHSKLREQVRELSEHVALAEFPAPVDPCTGIAAVWCHRCGDCKCSADECGERTLADEDCPLHGPDSRHCDLADDAPREFQR